NGATQWFAAKYGADNLVGITPTIAPCNFHESPKYIGGAFILQQNISWSFGVWQNNSNHRHEYKGFTPDWEAAALHLPLNDIDRFSGIGTLSHWQDWLKHPDYDEYWERNNLATWAGKISCPAFIYSGWFDIYTQGALDSFTMLRQRGGSKRARNFTRCVIGPWSHGEPVGELPRGNDFAQWSHAVEPKDRFLKNLLSTPGHDPLPDMPPLTYFMFGNNEWRGSECWPPIGTTAQDLYLHGDGIANTLYGDGCLSWAKPRSGEPVDHFVYDPHNPVPTTGGHGICVVNGSHDQTEVEKRADVLVYTSATLEDDLEVAGQVKVVLYAASTARDTDFTAKLVDVFPDGRAFNLADGIIRARYRKSMRQQVLLVPGEVNEYSIDLWSIANCFKKGHRIRLEIASSNFPWFARNPNTGHDCAIETKLKIAKQTIHHDEEHPSRLVLPVIGTPPIG
ncbi:MAG: CocE/NonD family hydrolase, partial [Lentisphaeria bacterium]